MELLRVLAGVMFLSLVSSLLKAQEVIQRTYYKKSYEETDRKNARLVKLVIQDTGGVLRYETRSYPKNGIIELYSYRDSVPVGNWLFNKRMVNYDFDMKYSREGCDNNIGYNVVTKRKLGVSFSDSLYVPGVYAISMYIAKHVRYPIHAINNGVEGMAVLCVLIDVDGNVSDVTVYKSSGSILLDKEAARVLREMPQRGKPFLLNSHAVEGRLILPVKFQIDY